MDKETVVSRKSNLKTRFLHSEEENVDEIDVRTDAKVKADMKLLRDIVYM